MYNHVTHAAESEFFILVAFKINLFSFLLNKTSNSNIPTGLSLPVSVWDKMDHRQTTGKGEYRTDNHLSIMPQYC